MIYNASFKFLHEFLRFEGSKPRSAQGAVVDEIRKSSYSPHDARLIYGPLGKIVLSSACVTAFGRRATYSEFGMKPSIKSRYEHTES